MLYPHAAGRSSLQCSFCYIVVYSILRQFLGQIVSQFVATVETWLKRNYNYSNSQVYNSGYSVVVPMDMVLELLN